MMTQLETDHHHLRPQCQYAQIAYQQDFADNLAQKNQRGRLECKSDKSQKIHSVRLSSFQHHFPRPSGEHLYVIFPSTVPTHPCLSTVQLTLRPKTSAFASRLLRGCVGGVRLDFKGNCIFILLLDGLLHVPSTDQRRCASVQRSILHCSAWRAPLTEVVP